MHIPKPRTIRMYYVHALTYLSLVSVMFTHMHGTAVITFWGRGMYITVKY